MSLVEASHAAECKRMAAWAGDPQSRAVRIGKAKRWLRYAEIYESEHTSLRRKRKAKLHFRLEQEEIALRALQTMAPKRGSL
jgi:hypothetical protein